jgi:uncharacterized membrane protein YphA (DoxX/SURF4 family)
MELGLLVLRETVGALFAADGAQKLFGWFGGHGVAGTAKFFGSMGLSPGRAMALGAGAAERRWAASGTWPHKPAAAAMLCTVMLCGI